MGHRYMVAYTYIEAVAATVPEPSAIVLACLGFGGVVAAAWRRRRPANPACVRLAGHPRPPSSAGHGSTYRSIRSSGALALSWAMSLLET
jgi:hypothetical protein